MGVIDPGHRVALIRINQLYKQGMAGDDLYQVTRKWWSITPLNRQPQWAFAVYSGIVKGVFRIDSWEQDPISGRWAFHGERSGEMERTYFGADVSDYFSRGARNPVQYVHC